MLGPFGVHFPNVNCFSYSIFLEETQKKRKILVDFLNKKRVKKVSKAASSKHKFFQTHVIPFLFPFPNTSVWKRKQKRNNMCLETETGEKGFEPLTFGFGDHYSTIETIPLDILCENSLDW